MTADREPWTPPAITTVTKPGATTSPPPAETEEGEK